MPIAACNLRPSASVPSIAALPSIISSANAGTAITNAGTERSALDAIEPTQVTNLPARRRRGPGPFLRAFST
jgi:hypothetical protein